MIKSDPQFSMSTLAGEINALLRVSLLAASDGDRGNPDPADVLSEVGRTLEVADRMMEELTDWIGTIELRQWAAQREKSEAEKQTA